MVTKSQDICTRLRIMGPDHNEAFSSFRNDNLCIEPACKTIGNGRDAVDIEKTKSLSCVRKITQIELLMHGSYAKGLEANGAMDYEYFVALYPDAMDDFRSWHRSGSTFLTMLNELTGDPINVIVPACHGGAIDSAITILKPGSTIISYAKAEEILTSGIPSIASEPLCEWCTPAEKFVRFIRKAAITTTFSMKLIDGSIFRYTYNPFDSKNSEHKTLTQLKEGVKRTEENFVREYDAATGEKVTYNFPCIEDEEIRETLTNHVSFLIYIDADIEKYRDLLKLSIEEDLALYHGRDTTGHILFDALLRQNFPLVKALIEFGTDVNVTRTTIRGQESALMLALENKFFDIAFFLIEKGANPNVVLFKNTNSLPMTPLSYAVYHGNIALLNLLLSHDADPNFKPYGINNASEPLNRAIRDKNLEMVNLLLDHGAKIDDGLLGGAIRVGELGIAKALLDHGAKPAEDFKERYSTKPDVVSLLEKYVAVKESPTNNDVHNIDSAPQSTFDPAKNTEFLSLVEHGDRSNTHPRLSAVGALLSTGSVDVNVKDQKSGKTALHIAASNHDPDMVHFLLDYRGQDYRAQVDAKIGADGATPLEVAVTAGCYFTDKLVIGALLAHGANPSRALSLVPESPRCSEIKAELEKAANARQVNGYEHNDSVSVVGDQVHKEAWDA